MPAAARARSARTRLVLRGLSQSCWCAQAMPNTTCLVVNHENITWNYYRGRDRAFLLAGALFRVGGAAALLSNRCAPPP
jgi:hypothetical protein